MLPSFNPNLATRQSEKGDGRPAFKVNGTSHLAGPGASPLFRIAALACLAAIIGCGEAKPDRVAVHPAAGTVTFKGQPTVGAVVTLHPKAPLEKVPSPRASVATNGAFQVTTFDRADGAPEGEYVVTVSWYKPSRSARI